MKIVIFGASGKTGTLITEQALAKGHHVIAFIRRPGSIIQHHPNLQVIVGNLNDESKLKEAIAGSDVCISALGGGSLTKHAPEVISGIDSIVTIMEQEQAGRLIYLSSIGAGESRNLMSPLVRFIIADIILRVALADHTLNEQRIEKSKLQWTIIRPGSLTNGPKTGNLKHGSNNTILKGSTKISRANVASFMLSLLEDSAYINKSVWLNE